MLIETCMAYYDCTSQYFNASFENSCIQYVQYCLVSFLNVSPKCRCLQAAAQGESLIWPFPRATAVHPVYAKFDLTQTKWVVWANKRFATVWFLSLSCWFLRQAHRSHGRISTGSSQKHSAVD